MYNTKHRIDGLSLFFNQKFKIFIDRTKAR